MRFTKIDLLSESMDIERRALYHLNHCDKNSKLYVAARSVCVKVFGERDTQAIEHDRDIYCTKNEPLFSVKYGYASMGPYKYQATIKRAVWGLYAVVTRPTAKEMYKAVDTILRSEYWRIREQKPTWL